MGDLFDQLKAGGPIKKSTSTHAKKVSPTKSHFTKNKLQFNDKHKSKSEVLRRESLPSPITVSSVLKKSKGAKARSLSPAKYGASNIIKSLKVKLERKKLEQFLTRPLEEHANNIRKKQEKIKDSNTHLKITPTKAQQKLFEPPVVGQRKTKAQALKQFNIKSCKVRIHRDNLQKLASEFKNKIPSKKDGKSKSNKRPASTSFSGSPPSKKGKISASDSKIKTKNSFFIKLNTSPSTKIEKKLKNLSRTTSSSEALHNKIKNSNINTITTPTKFSRSHLLHSFGKRFFSVQVKIERCTHPMMLTFESNDRARRLQAKRNKSKNLSVSFREQVEIFGGSSDSDDSCDEEFSAIPSNRKNRKSNNHSIQVPATPVVMPARLKKVENGKVVDDIELDPSLFVDPNTLVSSTPFSPGRKKRDHKSFSPLKDESSPSPRKEQLKLANEKIPPSGLRRLNIDEEDDEDDDCEYIVPIEMPQRRISCTSSNTSLPLAESTAVFPALFGDDITNNIVFNSNANDVVMSDYSTKNCVQQNTGPSLASIINIENGSEDIFQTAKDMPEKDNDINKHIYQLPTTALQLNLETSTCNELGQLQQTNGGVCNESGKHMDTINTMDDISINLFLDDSQTNEDDTHAKSYVDSLINETIDKLSKDIDEGARDQHYSDTT